GSTDGEEGLILVLKTADGQGVSERLPSTEARRLAGNVSDMTLWRWVNLGIIPRPLKIRNRNYWRRGQFLAALERGASGPEAA
ncbi:helix-turn-helix transcriptional regulator, partial [Allochromatium palmeri]|uniref:helix-turn-helix transcriptional regulator n=1 Tax=Allochromatium palmeri TaxID=231048 RepID=UPI001CA40CE4